MFSFSAKVAIKLLVRECRPRLLYLFYIEMHASCFISVLCACGPLNHRTVKRNNHNWRKRLKKKKKNSNRITVPCMRENGKLISASRLIHKFIHSASFCIHVFGCVTETLSIFLCTFPLACERARIYTHNIQFRGWLVHAFAVRISCVHDGNGIFVLAAANSSSTMQRHVNRDVHCVLNWSCQRLHYTRRTAALVELKPPPLTVGFSWWFCCICSSSFLTYILCDCYAKSHSPISHFRFVLYIIYFVFSHFVLLKQTLIVCDELQCKLQSAVFTLYTI